MAFRSENLTVASGATVSSVFSGAGLSVLGIIVPSNLSGTAMTFEVASSVDSTTFTALTNLATSVSLTVAASKAYKLPADLAPFPFFRIVTAAQTSGPTVFQVFGKSGA